MPGYSTRQQSLHFSGHDFRIRSLSDLRQSADPDHHAERIGISSARWSLFGQVLPSGRLLAQAMRAPAIGGKRIRELGCGLCLASLRLHWRGAYIVASDDRPPAATFLACNAAPNDMPAVNYRALRWDVPHDRLGRFDLVIGSDALYERGHADHFAALLDRHTHAHSEVLITEPGRGNSAPFTRAMAAQGFIVVEQRSAMDTGHKSPFRRRLLSYSRAGALLQ